MAVDDFLESEVAIAAAATATLLSPEVRRTVRKGAVYGTAGVLYAGETVVGAVTGLGRAVANGVSGGSSNGATRSPSPRRSTPRRSTSRRSDSSKASSARGSSS